MAPDARAETGGERVGESLVAALEMIDLARLLAQAAVAPFEARFGAEGWMQVVSL